MPAKKPPEKGAPFVAAVVEDPQAPPDALLVAGFVGSSSEEAHCRLYLDARLSDYVEIPEAAILHSQDLPKDSFPLGGTYLWITRDAEVIHGKADGERYKGGFLEGRLAQVFPTLPIVCSCLPQDASDDADGAQDPNSKGESNVTYTVPPFCPPAGSADIPTLPVTKCTTVPIVCCDVAGAQVGTAGAIPTVFPPTCLLPLCPLPTLWPPTCLPPICPAGGAGAQVQGQGQIPTLPVTQCTTVPIVCCGVAGTQAGTAATVFPPTCLPPVCGAGGAQGQIPTLPVTQCTTVPIVCCGVAGAQAGAAQTILPPTCAPQVCGAGGAQGQIPTIPVTKCTTVPIVCC